MEADLADWFFVGVINLVGADPRVRPNNGSSKNDAFENNGLTRGSTPTLKIQGKPTLGVGI